MFYLQSDFSRERPRLHIADVNPRLLPWATWDAVKMFYRHAVRTSVHKKSLWELIIRPRLTCVSSLCVLIFLLLPEGEFLASRVRLLHIPPSLRQVLNLTRHEIENFTLDDLSLRLEKQPFSCANVNPIRVVCRLTWCPCLWSPPDSGRPSSLWSPFLPSLSVVSHWPWLV